MKSTAKEAAGKAAAELIEEGMTVGIGTGSTARFFIEALAQRCRDGLQIRGVATSRGSHKLAKEAGIEMITVDEVKEIDIDVDGADEIDPKKRMIKGGGAALLREKIIASFAKEMIVIADASKQVDQLGAFGLPVEITPFGHTLTLKQIEQMGYRGALRTIHSGELVITDNRNYIIDLLFPQKIDDPEQVHRELSLLPGVVETGLFLTQAGRILIGQPDGTAQLC